MQSSSSRQSQGQGGTEYRVDWDSASIKTIEKNGTDSKSKGDFAIKLTALVEAGSGTGYLAKVKRRIDMVEKYVNCLQIED